MRRYVRKPGQNRSRTPFLTRKPSNSWSLTINMEDWTMKQNGFKWSKHQRLVLNHHIWWLKHI
jgi:hypothetical protein